MDITVENFTKIYDRQKAVDDISFSVHTGEVLGFLGPNGAGKTTTMKAITTYLQPTSGNIQIGEYSIYDHAKEIRKNIGYLPENNPLYYDLPVIDYLAFIGQLHDIPRTRLSSRIIEMIGICGLETEKHKKIGELSKGYRQRVGLAQAMIHDPSVLILDEPTTGLDPNQIFEIRDLIRSLGKEKTVLLSSHILAEVEASCDRILIINNGKIAADGTAEELRKLSEGNEILMVTIEDGERNEIFEALKTIDSIEFVDFVPNKAQSFEVRSKGERSSRRAIFQLCAGKHWVLSEMSITETKLEDVFRELTLGTDLGNSREQ